MVCAYHIAKLIRSYSMDSMALSLNVLSCAHCMDNLEDSHLLKKNTQVIYQKRDIFLVIKSFFLILSFHRFMLHEFHFIFQHPKAEHTPSVKYHQPS